jgi:hypothetical protein
MLLPTEGWKDCVKNLKYNNEKMKPRKLSLRRKGERKKKKKKKKEEEQN